MESTGIIIETVGVMPNTFAVKRQISVKRIQLPFILIVEPRGMTKYVIIGGIFRLFVQQSRDTGTVALLDASVNPERMAGA